MIRHSSSFMISLALHILVMIALFFTYKSIPKTPSKKAEEKMQICLCSVSIKPPKKIIEKEHIKKLEQKKALPKKTKPKPKPKKKIIPKKEPLPKPEPKIIEPQKKEIIEDDAIEEIIEEESIVVEEPVEEIQETSNQRQARMEEEYISEHLQKIAQLLRDNLYYPRSARKRNIQGRVTVKFKLSTSAEAFDIQIVSSKSEVLSRAAIRTIQNLSTKFPLPPEMLILQVPITYSLSR